MSSLFRTLLKSPALTHDRTPKRADIPRTIYSLWLQGPENAPPLVRLNFETWSHLNPGYELRVLDERAVHELLADQPLKVDELTPQALSDIVRVTLLAGNGGIWVDASVFPTKGLDDWLPSHLTSSGFFAFERPGPDRPISSWFLAATRDNRMMRAWREEVASYWSVPRAAKEGIPDDPVAAVTDWPDAYPYFWFHYLFQRLIERNEEFAAAWARCEKVSADGPHTMQWRLAQNPDLPPDELNAIASLAPVHKLNWRAAYPLVALSEIHPC